ncbi:hypothetical protein N7449_002872 [Penicillium cf. viridicatum]|uniref:Uncharacterized protein n=1 Tax=Penicillium cf. viridicatum TaxID=2972119 RepID=A0A9W9MW79_9EURO|nr:hypothetical protein N7449_002872 [Penicillium cf. viridicatum]
MKHLQLARYTSCFIDEHSTSPLVDHPPNPNHPISETFTELHLKRYKPSSFFPPSCSTHLPAMNYYRKFLFINVYHLSFTIPIHVF